MDTRTQHSADSSIVPLLTAQVPADFADWLDYVAIGALLAFSWQVEPIVFAGLAACLGFPYVLVGPVAGVIVDRSNLRSVLVLCNLGRALATACLALAWDWQSLLLVVFLRSCADAFFTPAKQSAIQALTSVENRMTINGISHAINQTSKIAAPALGGALLVVLQPQQIFLLNALISIAAMLVATLIRFPETANARQKQSSSLTSELLQGWKEVHLKPVLKAALLLMAAGFFSMFFYDTLIAPLIKEMNFRETVFGYALAAVGAGGVIGSLSFSSRCKGHNAFAIVSISAMFSGALTVALGAFDFTETNVGLSVLLSLFFLIGLATATMLVPIRTVIQTEAEPTRVARVFALSEALNTLALLSAPFVGAAIASVSGIGSAFVIGGLLMIVVGSMAAFCHFKQT